MLLVAQWLESINGFDDCTFNQSEDDVVCAKVVFAPSLEEPVITG